MFLYSSYFFLENNRWILFLVFIVLVKKKKKTVKINKSVSQLIVGNPPHDHLGQTWLVVKSLEKPYPETHYFQQVWLDPSLPDSSLARLSRELGRNLREWLDEE